MNFVDFVIDCYSHITSHVSQAFASCTHYTSYSLLNIVHVIVCVYGLTNQVLQILWLLCKINLLLENLWRMQEILFLGNLGLKFLFWKSYHHILMHFCSYISMLWVNSKCFSKTVFFSSKFGKPLPNSIDPFCFSIDRKFLNLIERASVCFDRSKLFFDRSNLFQIVFIESLSVSIDWGCFSIDRNSWNMFFKKVRLSFSKGLFFKSFSTFLSLRVGYRLHHQFFVVFLQDFCKVFVLEGR